MRKKLLAILFSASLLSGSICALSACEIATNTKLPTSQYEKVQFAFNGVEKSFKNVKAASSLAPTKKNRFEGKDANKALTTINSLYTESDFRGHDIEDLEFNRPPMIQFQCLKKVFEKIGDNYSFATKYYDTVTGEIYLDLETGLKAEEKDEYKMAYTFGLAIEINIDDNDLITADVSFDIKLSKDNVDYVTQWYVGMNLDYDMANASPNYTLLMVTENDEKDLPYYNHYVYEHDYVEVTNSAVKEWHQFEMESNIKYVIDNEHPNFDSYRGDDHVFSTSNCSWFKNGNYYKFTRMNDNKKTVVARTLCDDLGLNSTEINGQAFLNKEGTRNEVIKTIYSEFSTLLREDVIYDLVASEGDSKGKDERGVAGIRIIENDQDLNSVYVNKYHAIGNLLTNFTDPMYSQRHAPKIVYIDKNGGILPEDEYAVDFDKLNFYFAMLGDDVDVYDFANLNKVQVRRDITVEEAFALYLSTFGTDNFDPLFAIYVESYEFDVRGFATYILYDDNSGSGEDGKKEFPNELIGLTVPEYKGDNFVITDFRQSGGNNYALYIEKTTAEEIDNYINMLKGSGFEPTGGSVPGAMFIGSKILNGDLKVQVELYGEKDKGTLNIIVSVENVDPIGGEGDEGDDGGEGDGGTDHVIKHLSLVGDFNEWDEKDTTYTFEVQEDKSFIIEIVLPEGCAFKIAANYSWEIHYGYGYSDIINMNEFEEYFEPGNDDNIVATSVVGVIIEARLLDNEELVRFSISSVKVM